MKVEGRDRREKNVNNVIIYLFQNIRNNFYCFRSIFLQKFKLQYKKVKSMRNISSPNVADILFFLYYSPCDLLFNVLKMSTDHRPESSAILCFPLFTRTEDGSAQNRL